MRVISPSGAAVTIGPILSGITQVISPTGQTLTLATLDSNANVVIAPHGTGKLMLPDSGLSFTNGPTVGIAYDNPGFARMTLSAGGVFISSPYLWPSSDLATDLGRNVQRFTRGFFGQSGIRIGDGTNGANITANGTSPNENLNLAPGGTGVVSIGQAGNVSWLVGANDTNSGLYWEASDNDRFFLRAGGSNMLGIYGPSSFIRSFVHFEPQNDNAARLGDTAGLRWLSLSLGPSGIKLGGSGSPTTTGEITTAQQATKQVTAILNNTATGVATVTIPNAAHAAILTVKILATLGAGGAVGANEATAGITYDFAITRTAGKNAVVAVAGAYGSTGSAQVAGADSITVTAAASAISGAVGASNTFTVNVTIARGAGASTNHVAFLKFEILNLNGTGITVA